MELALLVWFAGISQGLGTGLMFIGFVLSAVSLVGYTLWSIFHKTDSKNVTKPPKKRVAIPVICLCGLMWIIGLIIPDQKTVYLATAAYMGQKLVQSETADKVVKIIDIKLDEYLKEAEEKLKK